MTHYRNEFEINSLFLQTPFLYITVIFGQIDSFKNENLNSTYSTI